MRIPRFVTNTLSAAILQHLPLAGFSNRLRRAFKLFATSMLIGAIGATPAVVADPLPSVYLERYGGTYALDCEDAHGERVSVQEDRLTLNDGDVELVAEDILTNLSYWGRMPPEDFEIAMLAGDTPDTSLMFLVYRDADGLFILFDGRPDDPSNQDAQYRKCES